MVFKGVQEIHQLMKHHEILDFIHAGIYPLRWRGGASRRRRCWKEKMVI